MTITVAGTTEIAATTEVRHTTCGLNNGRISVLSVAAQAPVTYVLSPGGISQTEPFFTNLAAGSYTINLRDAAGCTAQTSATVNDSEPLRFTADAQNPTCAAPDGRITLNATTGHAPFTATINGNAATVGTPNSGLAAGTYSIRVQDADGCADTTTVVLTLPQGEAPQVVYYRRPVQSAGNTLTMQIVDVKGLVMFETTDPNAIWDGFYENRPVKAGTYYLIATWRSTATGEVTSTDRSRVEVVRP
jgi:hypothetical protein